MKKQHKYHFLMWQKMFTGKDTTQPIVVNAPDYVSALQCAEETYFKLCNKYPSKYDIAFISKEI